ncbi:MAG: hypothetical protein J7502_04750 [Flavisolibacter sp.]|nr:hypothetical protein [Flavisolibacter sp.]
MTKEEKMMYLAAEAFMLVIWPESQIYMDEEWFQEEAILALGIENSVGCAAYFIPLKRIIDFDIDGN